MSPAQMFGDISSSLSPEPWQGAWSLGRGVGSEGQRDNKSPVRTMASCGLFSGGGSREGSSPTAQPPCPLLPPGAVPVTHGAAKSLQKLKYLSSRNTAPRARAALSSLSLGKGRQAVTLHLQHTEIGYFFAFSKPSISFGEDRNKKPAAVYIFLPRFLLALLAGFDLDPQLIGVSIFSTRHDLSKTFHAALPQPSQLRSGASRGCQAPHGHPVTRG